MSNPARFVPRTELSAMANLAAFIRLAREELTAFGAGAWDGDRWKHHETVAVFATGTAPMNAYHYTPMVEPFVQFAKAYLRYTFSHAPVKNVQITMQALRCVEAALLDAGPAEIGRLSGAIMDASAQKCRDFYVSEDLQCNTGRKLEKLFNFVREHQLVPGLPVWRSPFNKPKILTEDLGAAGQAHREKKLPSDASMLALADLFAIAGDRETQYFTSIYILLMATPSRVSEVLILPVDCIQWEPDDTGLPQMYLRWHAAKGGGTMKKWVVPAMQGVVQEAVRRLLEIGQSARDAAKFAFDNPGKFMSHTGCLAEPAAAGDRPLSPNELCGALGIARPGRDGGSDDGVLSVLKQTKWIKALIDKGPISYPVLAQYVSDSYAGRHWPYIDEGHTVRAWEALCLHRVNEFRNEFSPKQFSWRLPTSTEVNVRFGPEKGCSLFERHGFKNGDGSPIKLTSHQPRHWLSTMSERAGMDDYTLARWAGRTKVTDNRHYDHRTPEERADEAREILQFRPPPLLERFKSRQPVSYHELGVDLLGTAKATLYGMCVHDYAMAPCQKQRECMTCKEHVCIKGDHVRLDRILLLEAQTEGLLQQAQRAHEDGMFGADRWVDNHKWKLAHVRSMRLALEHPDVVEGTPLRIGADHDPSPVRRALMDLGLVGVSSTAELGPTVIPLALTNSHAEKDHN